MPDRRLDRCIWNALGDRHARFCRAEGPVRRYDPAISPFVACEDPARPDHEVIRSLALPDEDLSFVETVPVDAGTGYIGQYREIVQMVAGDIPDRCSGVDYRVLDLADRPQMLELALLTKPGPFRLRTPEFGRFFGVFDGDRLIAMGGQRLSFGKYCEISGICTHPDYRGRGFGAAMISAVGRGLQADGFQPFLHANADNHGAIALYESLGLRKRKHFWHTMWVPEA